MKKLIFLILIIIFNISIFSITIGLYKAPPIVIDENSGFFNDILKKIADNNNIQLKFVIDSQKNLIEKLRNGEIDAIAPLARTPEREKEFDFNKEPLFFEWAVLYVREGLHLNSILDLKNLKIGVMKTDVFYTGENGIKDIIDDFKIKVNFVELDSYEEIFELLDKKKIDAGVVPRFFGLDEEKFYNVKKTSMIFKSIGGYIMYKKDNNLGKYFDLIDKELRLLKEDNNSYYYKMFNKYFEPVVRKETPEWVKTFIIFGLILIVLIISLSYVYSKLLKVKIKSRTHLLNETLEKLKENYNELKSSRNLIEEIVELSPNPIYIKTVDQKIRFVNTSFAKFLNIEKKDLIGKDLFDIFSGLNNKLLEDSVIEDIEVIQYNKKGYINTFDVIMDGKTYYFKDYKTIINLNNGEKGILVLWMDVTENIEYQKKLEKNNVELEKINEKLFEMINIVNMLGTNIEDLYGYFDYLLKFAIKLSDSADYGSISISRGKEWKFISAVGHDINVLRELKLKSEYMIQTGEELKIFTGEELSNYNNMIFDDEETKNKFFKAIKKTKEIMIATTGISKDRILSFALDIDINSQKSFTENDKLIFKAFINIAKTILSSKMNIDVVKNAYLNFANKLALIAETHDDITGQHIYRVGELSYYIAQKLGLPEDKILEIKEFSPLHDIGKIFIPLEILNKNSRLTDEEFEIMKKHTIYAERLLGNDPYFETALKIALYHHEKYNGGGYPFNLKGNQIPIEAQIVSLVDVYDALRSKRPYKDALSHEEVMKIILNGDDRTSPKDFNPLLLDILKKYSEEIKKIYNTFSD